MHDVQPLSSHSNSAGPCSNQDDFRQALLNSINETTYNNSMAKQLISDEESKLVAAKKHSMAESNRRSRINTQFATLRTILPNLIKVCNTQYAFQFKYSHTRQQARAHREVLHLYANASIFHLCFAINR